MLPFISDLEAPLLKLSPWDVLTLDDATKGVHIFGGIGSGKTSGSGKMLAGAYLRAGMGGLVTAVKPEEISLWKKYAEIHGRSASLVLFDENEGFNFLSYELGRQGAEGIGTVVECLMRVLEAAKRASPTVSGGGGDSEFYDSATRLILRYSLLPLYVASGSLSMDDIIRFVSSAPKSPKDPKDRDWQNRSFMYQAMNAAYSRPRVEVSREAMRRTVNFWSEEYTDIPEKTRGNINISVTTVLDRFRHGRLARAFTGKTTWVPELSFHGVVTVLCMPTLTWNEDGIIGQQLLKFMWQRCVLSRNALEEKHRARPLFLWSDEAQETVNSYDGQFLGMCRASKCCVTYLTQSLPAYYAKMGGNKPENDAHDLVGKFNSNIFHSNACPVTNEYASRVIGRVLTRRRTFTEGSSESVNRGMNMGDSESSGTSTSFGSSHGQGYSLTHSSGSNTGSGSNRGENRGRGTSESISRGYNEGMENAVEPGDFARHLMTGGRENGNQVTGIWFQGSRVFKCSGGNYMVARFRQ